MGGARGPAKPFVHDPWSFICRSMRYWLGWHGRSFAAMQPTDDPFNKINSTWFFGLQLFGSIFGVGMMELCMARPPSEEIGHTWSWAASAASFAVAVPPLLITIPIGFIQAWSLACVPREEFRETLCAHAFALGLPHQVGLFSFYMSFLGLGLRLYALFQFEVGLMLVLSSYLVGVLIALLYAHPTLQLFLSVMDPWDEAISKVGQQLQNGVGVFVSEQGDVSGPQDV